MKVEKKIIGKLEKCYSIAPLKRADGDYILVAAEKTDRCILFDDDGNEVDTVWTEPGGTMTMVQVPGTDGQFLATHKFYSPNDSKEAKIVIVTPASGKGWEIRTLVDLPHIHRFDIVERGGVRYLIACALKSGHEYKDDWSSPGKVYAAVLPEDLSGFDEGNQLKLEVIKDGLLKNHGYYRFMDKGTPTALISAENGVFQLLPPARPGGEWEIRNLLDIPASDAVLVDLDEDGEPELGVIESFHGSRLSIFKKRSGSFERVYTYGKPAEFAHAIYGGLLCGKPVFVIGHREGERNLLAFTWDPEQSDYQVQILDHGCGPANVYTYLKDGADIMISTNREVDEIAMYVLKSE